jgi:hypothetical protein
VGRDEEIGARDRKINEIGAAVSSPEKAGVGGSTPSLATIIPKNLRVPALYFQPKVQPNIFHWIVSVRRCCPSPKVDRPEVIDFSAA